MATINPYLNFDGNTEEAFNFYKSVFGGEFINLTRFKDTPEGSKIPPEAAEKLMHISLPIGKSNLIMATDAIEAVGNKFIPGNNMALSLAADSREEADKLYAGLSAGGTIESPIGEMFWGSYFGMFTDKFGVRWMVSFDKK